MSTTGPRPGSHTADDLTAEVRAGRLTGEQQVGEELTRRFAERLAAATKASTQQNPSPTTAPVSQPVRGT